MPHSSIQEHHPSSGASISSATQYRVLLVEDDVELARLTADYLNLRGLVVLIEHDGGAALERIRREQPDLIVLDVMLPGIDGFEICRRLRQESNDVPVLMLTARDEDIDQVLGLELGADDYLTKPVQPRVLLAHMQAILRRIAPADAAQETGEQLNFGRLRINRLARSVILGGSSIELTTAEFDLLWLLAANAGRVLPRNEILRVLRGLEYDGIDRSIDSRVSRLRRKLGDDALASAQIKTVRPHGYLFSPIGW
jgi:DNA-binding response OmpR family regulator